MSNPQFQTITPAQAEKWLNEKAPNRSLKENKVLQFAQDMEAGLWRKTHQGIAFGEDGKLIDGQHRLEAITLARKPIVMMVTYGLTKDSMMAIDQGDRRSFVDNIEIATGKHYPAKLVSVARALITLRPGARKAQSVDAVNRALQAHGDALSVAAKPLIDSHVVGIASVITSVAMTRAYYHVKPDRLRELIAALITGMVEDPERDGVAIRLRDHVRTAGWRAEARQAQLVALYRLERAIKAFADGERLTKMVGAVEELFPLPEEGAPPAKAGGELGRRQKAQRERAENVGKSRHETMAIARREKVIEAQRLRYEKHMTNTDIGRQLGISRNTASNYVNEKLPKGVVESFRRDSL